MASLEVLQSRLSEAEGVYHDWRLGKHARSFTDSNGEKVDYGVEAMRGLPGYIAELQRQIDILNGDPTANAPLRVWI